MRMKRVGKRKREEGGVVTWKDECCSTERLEKGCNFLEMNHILGSLHTMRLTTLQMNIHDLGYILM